MSATITRDELLKALQDALHASQQSAETGMTVGELADALRLSPMRVREILKGQIAAGRVVAARAIRLNMIGDRQPVPVYRWMEQPKTSRAKRR